ncbi:M20/M25/M40 family metallo-hydrolase [Ancylomarina sp. 16SWW S1-10-2]|uniref:M20/M25/M40 family metallo-hydrolase n=1 Tax=Ancylomarina sp. 16SWW S1-10-2 TaxID=2499681 RepID=UPI0012AD4159|nr:M20/M25/M40 family metallo-hydrolase [Ancylomarina sp. 16SWW S1-10-2]MRT92973.1 M20/M25/M40 family metallo-hydrolase [Ancylomarina sp. 16SWW S1-10-2]
MSERMIKQFMEMVQIDSESGNEANFISYLEKEYQKLGAKTELDSYGNMIAKLPAKGCEGKEPILLSCHSDTVKPGIGIEPVLADGVIRSKGDTILGADDKAGIAEMLEALRIAEVHPPIEVAISREEEIGLFGVKNLDYSKLTAKRGFLLDNDTLDTIIIGGPSYFTFDVTVKGKSAHAGMEPEKGINAIVAASKAILALKLGRLDNETTANVGIIEGGIVRNGVPDKVTFKAECRSLNHEKAVKLAAEMRAVMVSAVEAEGAQIEIDEQNLCKAVDIPESSFTVDLSKKALKTVGIDAKATFMTGFTDASIYNNMGIEMAVVGIGAKNEHALDEHIYVADMEKALKMIVELLRLSAQ